LTNTRLRVTQPFTAAQVASRRRETFRPGELIVLVDGSELPSEARFIRLNGLRPSRGVECRYVIGSDELQEKTEIAGRPQFTGAHPHPRSAGGEPLQQQTQSVK
jgi:hypothetical protein